MSKEEILARLRKILRAEFDLPEEQVVLGALLVDDLDLDSVDAVALAVRLEEETNLEFSEEDLRAMTTVEHVVDLVHSRLPARSA